jgi:hypothetical protein
MGYIKGDMTLSILGKVSSLTNGRTNELHLEIEDNGDNKVSLIQYDTQIETPKVFNKIASEFKYASKRFIIRLLSESITYTDSTIVLDHGIIFDPCTLSFTYQGKTIDYSGRSTHNFMVAYIDSIKTTFDSILPVKNPEFKSHWNGVYIDSLEHVCKPDFDYCPACPFKKNVFDCMLGYPVKI